MKKMRFNKQPDNSSLGVTVLGTAQKTTEEQHMRQESHCAAQKAISSARR
jgi:hypothetical protein